EPRTFESLLEDLFDTYSLTMNFEQYALVGSTVRSLLAWLKDDGRLAVSFDHNRLCFTSV
ncbi:MAG: MBL fold metallo-hydrolase, partial [Clostridia bacterium]|nr:MBL fold metallo-hydrolase [Clostridia bacterium]